MIGLWWSVPAAALPSEFPWCAEVELPNEPARIWLPNELRSTDDPADGSDLFLADANGDPIPFVRIEGSPGDREVEALVVNPTVEAHRFTVHVGERPIDRLSVTPAPGTMAATVTVLRDDAVIAGPTLVWQLDQSSNTEIPVAELTGVVTVSLAPVGTTETGVPSISAVRLRGPVGAPDSIPVRLGPPVRQENGYTRWTLSLPRALPVDRFVVEATGDVFSRQIGFDAMPVADWPEAGLGMEPTPSYPHLIQRISVGSVSLESTTVDGPWTGADRYQMLVSTDGQASLPVTAVIAQIDPVALLVLDPPAGPATVCGGAPVGTAAPSELRVATPELVRAARTVVRPGPVTPNPDWVAPEVAANLAAPGAALETARFRFRRSVDGEGLLRIGVPLDALTDARPDLGDLRLATDDLHQIPYVLRRIPVDPPLAGVATERFEEGTRSFLRVKLPQRGLPVARIAVRSPAPVFERDLTVYRPEGSTRAMLRRIHWSGKDGGILAFEIGGTVDDELLIEVENGDDPPLPLAAEVEVTTAAYELLAVLPPGGATLWYGSPTLERPDYDLALLLSELRRRASDEAVVGPAEAAGTPNLGWFDKLLLAGGVGALALGLLALSLELLRRLPAKRVPASEPA